MIEINLSEQRKASKSPVVMGIDITKINIKLLLGSILFLYVPDFTIYTLWESEAKDVQKKIDTLNAELEGHRKELLGSKKLKEELEAYNARVESLKARSNQIDQILKIKSNPKKILEKLARSAPADLWLDNLTINSQKNLTIIGGSASYKSIGLFISSINDSPFFGKSMILKESKTKEEMINGKSDRTEEFKIEGKIELFDPF